MVYRKSNKKITNSIIKIIVLIIGLLIVITII